MTDQKYIESEDALQYALAACPFCASKNLALISHWSDTHHIECDDCRTRGPISSEDDDIGRQEAIEMWNTRK